jgi:hypothetical protein
MPRIITAEATAGKPIAVSIPLSTSWVTILEAPDFDIPNDDPTSVDDRRIAPGQIEILSPLLVANNSASAHTVDVRIARENGINVPVATNFPVPGYDTGIIRVQGQFLLKRTQPSANGDRLQVKASTASTVWATISALESQAGEHVPDNT